jgi:hypothetical protein
LFFGGAQSTACDFQSVTCRAPPKKQKGGVGGVSAINRQPRWGFEKAIPCLSTIFTDSRNQFIAVVSARRRFAAAHG